MFIDSQPGNLIPYKNVTQIRTTKGPEMQDLKENREELLETVDVQARSIEKLKLREAKYLTEIEELNKSILFKKETESDWRDDQWPPLNHFLRHQLRFGEFESSRI